MDKKLNDDELDIEKMLKESLDDSDSDTSGKNPKVEALINLIKSEKVELFHDQFQKPYVKMSGRTMKLRSNTFKDWLSSLAWKKLEIAVSSTTVGTAITILAGEACNDGKQYNLNVRVAWHDKCIWYDMGNGTAIKISKDSWDTIKDPPILFFKFNHQKEQVLPKKGGNIKDLMSMINLKNEDEQLLFQIVLIACFIPDIPHPIIVSHGPQGSAKSMLHRILKSIVDPSQTPLLSPPSEMREFIQTASHHWVITLDNLSYLSDWLSDALCKVCTGSGFSKRELYTDDDDIIYSLKHIVGLNGIGLVATKPDLLERSILIEHETIPENERKTERELGNRFATLKPLILGAIFDALSKTIAVKSSIKAGNFPRMADFADWGCAIATAIGVKPEEFLRAYKDNINKQHDEALEASLIGLVILEFMKNKNLYEGTATELLRELNFLARSLDLDIKNNYWPKSPNMVWKKIVAIKSNLEAKGIIANKNKSGVRKIVLIKK